MNLTTNAQQADILNCFIQKQDTVTIPPLIDPQLQNAAFSVIEAAKSQLSEIKLADLYSQQLQGDQKGQFISEFLYHWAGVDSKPPESMIESSKKSLHSIIHGFISTHGIDPEAMNQLISPLLPYLTNVTEVEDFSTFLTRSVFANPNMPEEEANIVDLATLGTVISEVSIETDERSESIKQLQNQRLKDIQRAFDICLNPHPSENELESNEHQASYFSTTRAVFGSEAPTQTQDDIDDIEGDASNLSSTDPGILISQSTEEITPDKESTDKNEAEISNENNLDEQKEAKDDKNADSNEQNDNKPSDDKETTP